MLEASFCHLPGIGLRAEQRLWLSGVTDWQRLLRLRPEFISPQTYAKACSAIEESNERLSRRDVRFFLKHLPGYHKIRVLREFGSSAAFLDIETSGLEAHSAITVATVWQAEKHQYFIRGQNLEDLIELLLGAELVVTFCGERFDIPVLNQYLGQELACAHLDVWPLARAVGYRGPLKVCAKIAGVQRQTGERMNGARAAELWQIFTRTNDERALKLLLAYNSDDILSLLALCAKLYTRSMEIHPARPRLNLPDRVGVEYDARWEVLFFEI
jgi:uncharacterized protein YprB with RNaseH-like and TPR domain